MDMFNAAKETLSRDVPEAFRGQFLNAFAFAEQAHEGQKRKSGEPYFTHPLAVATTLWERFHDSELTIAALLHDTVEDCGSVRMEKIYSEFGQTIGFLVDALTKNHTSFRGMNIQITDRTERLLWAGMQDIRALLIKIADREHNIETLKHLKTDKQVRIAFETQAIYEPLKLITDYYTATTVKEAAKRFKGYLALQNIHTAAELKQNLYSQFFKEFNPELYNLVYNNSEKVVWEIEDRACFETMLKSHNFEQYANIQCLWTDGTAFRALFTFDKGYIIEPNAGLRIVSYKT